MVVAVLKKINFHDRIDQSSEKRFCETWEFLGTEGSEEKVKNKNQSEIKSSSVCQARGKDFL